jgi:hypothetical protein
MNMMLQQTYVKYCDIHKDIIADIQDQIEVDLVPELQIQNQKLNMLVDLSNEILMMLDREIIKRDHTQEAWTRTICMHINIKEIMNHVHEIYANPYNYTNETFCNLVNSLIKHLNNTLIKFDLWQKLYDKIDKFCITLREFEAIIAIKINCEY